MVFFFETVAIGEDLGGSVCTESGLGVEVTELDGDGDGDGVDEDKVFE
jgi:hypothetical protein